jgi:hypothetical protein
VFDITSDGTLEICPGLWQTAVRVQATNVTLRGGGPRATTLLGDGTIPVVEFPTAGGTFVVEDLTLSGGQFGVRHAWRRTTDYADLTLRRAVVRGNENAQGFGAGIALRGDLTLNDVNFTKNRLDVRAGGSSLTAEGAAAWSGGDASCTGTPSSHFGFAANRADEGGGLYLEGATRFDARDCEWGADALDNAVGDLRGQLVYDGVGESTFSCLAGTCRER